MKVKIISPVVNSPTFLDIQIAKFKENLSNDFELICIDDSKQDSMNDQFIQDTEEDKEETNPLQMSKS